MASGSDRGISLEAAQRQVTELSDEIRRHEHLYYVEDNPEISDAEFDRLMRRLLALESSFPLLVQSDSPSQRVGGAPREGVEKAEHSSQLLSLDNAFDEGELRSFDRRARELLEVEAIDYVGEFKFDGVSMALRYKAGALDIALTRGDGRQGEVVTPNARTLRTVKLSVSSEGLVRAGVPPDFEVRGEVVMPRKSFAQLNRQRLEAGEPQFANPRNAAAGTLRMLDPKVTAARRLDFFAYMLLVGGADALPTHWESLDALEFLGFKVDKGRARIGGVDEMLRFRDERMALRGALPYEIDGLVFKVNDAELRQRLGATSKAPRWAIACKPTAQQVETAVLGIDIQVGRTGAITPRALLRPVQVGGVTVARATLHNEDEIARLGLQIGDAVLLERSGDVIPKVVRVIGEGPDRKPFKMPTACPVCESELLREEGEVILRCVNNSCKARLKQSIEHFAHRSAMNIEGIGERLAEQLVDAGLIADIADLYRLKAGDLARLAKDSALTPEKAEEIVAAIQSAKQVEWVDLLSALSIPYVGPATAKAVARQFPSRSEVESATEEKLASAKGVKAPAARRLREYFDDTSNRAELDRLAAAGMASARSGQALASREQDRDDTGIRRSPRSSKRNVVQFLRVLGVRGMGELLVSQLLKDGTIRSPADLFEISPSHLAGKGTVRLGAKSARKIVESLEASKKAPLGSLLFGLGIRYVGSRTAHLLAGHFGSLDSIAKATVEELADVQDVGPNIAASIDQFFSSDRNRDLIERLRGEGLSFEDERTERAIPQPFAGKTFVITGSLEASTRAEAKAMIESLGGKVTGSVSGRTDYLLAGAKAGSKLAKARRLDVSVVAESDMEALSDGNWGSFAQRGES